MTVETRKELYTFLRSQGILKPRQLFVSSSRQGKARVIVPDISGPQAETLVENVSWVHWRITAGNFPYATAKTHSVRPTVEEDAALAGRAGAKLPRWLTAVQSLPGKAIRGTNRLFYAHNTRGRKYSDGARTGRIIAGVFIYMLALDYLILFPWALAVVGGAMTPFLILVTLLIGYLALSVIVANDLRYRRVILELAENLAHTVAISESIPQSWSNTLHDYGVHTLVVEWMLQRPGIDALMKHIAVGERLQRDLPTDDSRHDSIQSELGSQRVKLDGFIRNRENLAATIDQAAESVQTWERLSREAELRRIAEKQLAQREQAQFQQKLHDVGAREEERLRTHDKIDRWFENGPA